MEGPEITRYILKCSLKPEDFQYEKASRTAKAQMERNSVRKMLHFHSIIRGLTEQGHAILGRFSLQWKLLAQEWLSPTLSIRAWDQLFSSGDIGFPV